MELTPETLEIADSSGIASGMKSSDQRTVVNEDMSETSRPTLKANSDRYILPFDDVEEQPENSYTEHFPDQRSRPSAPYRQDNVTDIQLLEACKKRCGLKSKWR